MTSLSLVVPAFHGAGVSAHWRQLAVCVQHPGGHKFLPLIHASGKEGLVAERAGVLCTGHPIQWPLPPTHGPLARPQSW